MSTVTLQRRRRADAAAVLAVCSLAVGETSKAKRASYLADAIDDSGRFCDLPGAVERAVSEFVSAGKLSEGSWDRVGSATGSGPLGRLVEQLRAE